MTKQMEVRVVLQCDVYGRECFYYLNDLQAFIAMRRLLAESRVAFQKDGIERIVGIVVGDLEDRTTTES